MILFQDNPTGDEKEQPAQEQQALTVPANDTSGKDLARFGVTNIEIQEYKDKFMAMTLTDVKDKKGLQAIYQGRQFIKKKRTTVESQRKEMVAEAVEWQRKVNTAAKQITAELLPIEQHLQDQEDFIANETKRIADEENRIKQERLSARIDILIENGMAFDGRSFLVGTVSITNEEIDTFTAEDFAGLVELASLEHERLLKEKEAQEKAKAEEAAEFERLKASLAKQKAEQDEKERLFEQQQREFKEQQDKRANEIREEAQALEKLSVKLREEKQRFRASELFAMGLKYNGQFYYYEDMQVLPSALLQEDNEWPVWLQNTRIEVEAKMEESAQAKKMEEEKKWIEQEALKLQAAEDAKNELLAQQEKVEKEKREAKEEEQLEIMRKEALKPDKVKLQDFTFLIDELNYKLPEFESEEVKNISGPLMESLFELARITREALNKL